ncbi:MAG: hypothetical protein JNJ41_18420 [Bacteroidia bacterium]|nr:hypothetical protein [Bacteroidia bacterium]
MKKIIPLFFILVLSSFSIQDPKDLETYKRINKNGLDNGTIFLRANGTFLTQFFGGCDGMLESQGTWKINKDTLIFTDREHRMMNDRWKKSECSQKYLIKNRGLIAFSIAGNKMVCDSNEVYKKVKNK